MYSQKDLTQDIEHVLEELSGARDWEPDWITQAVMKRHSAIEGDDAEFYVCCSRISVRHAVVNRLNRFKLKPPGPEKPDPQLVLEGFERLQKRYVMEIGGRSVSRQIEELTDADLASKEEELLAMGGGCLQHAEEIGRYRRQRRAAA